MRENQLAPDQSIIKASRFDLHRTSDEIDTSREATKASNLYWCSICEVRRSFKNLSDWRKHEKEHVDAYVCMLRGSVDKTTSGVKCSFCGMSNPSEEHLGAHNIQACGKGAPASFSCKRRADLVKHLKKCHNVHEKAQGEAVADQWKETTKKQAWSCGFCIHLVHTFGERLKHIATHFEQGRRLDEWDTTNVIEGLLLQPGMVNAWKMPLDWRSSETMWRKDIVKNLQHDLEFGPSDPMHATALAETVYNARQPAGQLLKDDKSFLLYHWFRELLDQVLLRRRVTMVRQRSKRLDSIRVTNNLNI